MMRIPNVISDSSVAGNGIDLFTVSNDLLVSRRALLAGSVAASRCDELPSPRVFSVSLNFHKTSAAMISK